MPTAETPFQHVTRTLATKEEEKGKDLGSLRKKGTEKKMQSKRRTGGNANTKWKSPDGVTAFCTSCGS
jgi:hypothetical protein